MPFERIDKRTRCATSFIGKNKMGRHARRIISVEAGSVLNYATNLRGRIDATVNLTPQHITKGCDGYICEANHTFFLGKKPGSRQDGWFGFGGRRGEKTIYARAIRFGCMDQVGSFADLFGATEYKRARLKQDVEKRTIKNSLTKTTIKSVWRDIFPNAPGKVDAFYHANGGRVKNSIVIPQKLRERIQQKLGPQSLDDKWIGFVYEVDLSQIDKILVDGRATDLSKPADGNITLWNSQDDFIGRFANDHALINAKGAIADANQRVQKLYRRFWKESDGRTFMFVGLPYINFLTMMPGDMVFDPDITDQADTVFGYQDGGTTWATTGDLYIWNSSGTLNTVGVTYDGSALAAGEDTVDASDIDMTWGSDTDVNANLVHDFDFEDAANPTQFSGSRLPRSVTLVGSAQQDTQTGNPSGAYTTPSLQTPAQDLVTNQGPANIGNINMVATQVTDTTDYVSFAAASDSFLTIDVSAGGGDPEARLIGGKLTGGGLLIGGRLAA